MAAIRLTLPKPPFNLRRRSQSQSQPTPSVHWIKVLAPANHNEKAVAEVARLSRENFAGRAAGYDAEASFPFENYADLRGAGLLSLTVPKEHGGWGADPVTYTRCLLEMAKGCPSTALTFNMHANVLSGFINVLASEEQKRRYFTEVVERGVLFASVTSEPESSFRDRFILRTRVARESDGFRFSGLKHFCSLGDAADYCFVSGVLDGAASAREGLLAALIPRDSPGVQVAAPWNATGMRGTTSHTIEYDCLVSEEAVIGRPGQFFEADFSGFALGYAAVYLGIAECAYEHIVEYARSRVIAPATEPLIHHPLTQRSIGEMATSLRAGRLLLMDAAEAKASGDKDSASIAINQAKYFAGELGVSVTTQAMRLAGGSGFLKSSPLERWHRDSLAGPVMPPANDRCLETIGKLVCGLEAATLEIE